MLRNDFYSSKNDYFCNRAIFCTPKTKIYIITHNFAIVQFFAHLKLKFIL